MRSNLQALMLAYYNMCNLHSFNRKNFVAKGFKSPKNLFCQRSENKKSPVNDLS